MESFGTLITKLKGFLTFLGRKFNKLSEISFGGTAPYRLS
jgi:hypothetical protein